MQSLIQSCWPKIEASPILLLDCLKKTKRHVRSLFGTNRHGSHANALNGNQHDIGINFSGFGCSCPRRKKVCGYFSPRRRILLAGQGFFSARRRIFSRRVKVYILLVIKTIIHVCSSSILNNFSENYLFELYKKYITCAIALK